MLRPTVTKVVPLTDYRLEVEFDNGQTGVFDVKPYIKGSWFEELQDEHAFGTVFANGITVEWAGGQDICPDDLYYGCKMQQPIGQA